MPLLNYNRSNKSADVTLLAKATTTTNIDTTTDLTGSSYTVSGYREGVFVVDVNANSTCAPKAYLDGSVDGSNWAHYATLHSDLTTTANQAAAFVQGLPTYIRGAVGHLTTSMNVRLAIKGTLRV